MSDHHLNVGEALSRAMARAEELRRSSDRKPRIRLMTQWGDHADGVTIVARVAAKTNAELEAQADLGVRHVPFAELDARAGELRSRRGGRRGGSRRRRRDPAAGAAPKHGG